MEIPDELLPSVGGYGVRCDKHLHTVGYIGAPRGEPYPDGRRTWTSFEPCGECPCPAGGDHDWGTLEEAGTGTTWAGCENCGAPMPLLEDRD